MNEELLAFVVIFAISGYWLYTLNTRDRELGRDIMDIHRGRFKLKVILLMVVIGTFLCVMVKLYRLLL